jgi:23S rRNA (cytosine1962-C5)-methyltransferase
MSPRALSLPDDLVRRVGEGTAVLAISSLADPGPAREPGTLLRLVDSRGAEVGTALADPENDALRVLSRHAIESLDRAFLCERVRRALALRARLGLADGRSSYRLLNGEGDGLGGLAADVYGRFAVLYAYSRGLFGLGRAVAEAILEVCPLDGVVLKLRAKDSAQPGKVKQDVVGVEPPKALVAEELGVPYEVHLLSGLNVGLFTDMREHRCGLARYVRERRVLNTFAYTGAFSVTAARAGAAAVTSVDLSTGVLKWARENFRLSGIDADAPRFRFEASDVGRFLEAAAERGERFDVVILDPPTFSAARAAGWSMKNDYPELVARAAALLPEDGGILWLAANAHRGIALERVIAEGLTQRGREVQVLETGGLPPDYPTPAGYAQARYLQVAVVRVV